MFIGALPDLTAIAVGTEISRRQMKQAEAKALIIQEWSILSESQRETDSQAAAFAMAIKDKYHFRCSGDRYQVIKGWLRLSPDLSAR